ncbi:MAG: hypothetical protein KTR28_03505 [Micavibrio sp.]|nr:hypothetical protein [Micavibrio sp.]
MIISFGSILILNKVSLTASEGIPESFFAQDYDISFGGRALIQAIACARSNAKTALIGCVGDDFLSKDMLLKARQNEVITSGVSRSETLYTGSLIELGTQQKKTILALGASEEASHEQIPEEILNEANIILVQDDFPATHINPLIQKAKNARARCILSLGARNKPENYDFKDVSYIIAGETYPALKSIPSDKLIILLKDGGCRYTGTNGEVNTISSTLFSETETVDTSCADDTFVGVFAACLKNADSLQLALQKASVARMLTASKAGGYKTLPYSSSVKEALERL